MTESAPFVLQVTRPAERQLSRLSEGVAAAIVEFMLGPLVENPYRIGSPLQGELAGLRSTRRGAYRIIYQIHDDERLVVVHRIDHRSTVHRTQ